jgi:hypothetical protein
MHTHYLDEFCELVVHNGPFVIFAYLKKGLSKTEASKKMEEVRQVGVKVVLHKHGDWIPWYGGDQPVQDHVLVDVRSSDNYYIQDTYKVYAQSQSQYWCHVRGGHNITHYRLHVKEGYVAPAIKKVLTEEYQDLKDEWEGHYGSCTCGITPAPCSSCTHDGNPLSLENNPEAWKDEEPLPLLDKDTARGRTTKQLKAAHRDGIYICHGSSAYYRALLKFIERPDIRLVGSSWLNNSSKGFDASKPVYVDHAVKLTLVQEDLLKRFKSTVNKEECMDSKKEDGPTIVTANSGKWAGVCAGVGHGSLDEFCIPTRPLQSFNSSEAGKGVLASDKWMLGLDVLVVDEGRSYTTYVSKAEELGLSRYKRGEAPLDGKVYTLVSKLDQYCGIECKATGNQYIVEDGGLNFQLGRSTAVVQGTTEKMMIEGKLSVDNEVEESSINTNNQTKTKEGNIMTTVNRTTVTANLIDLDSGVGVEDSLVFTLDLIVQDGKVQEAIQDAIRQNERFEEAMLHHNNVRSDTVNLDALERHGREVMLREVKISDLHWEIK